MPTKTVYKTAALRLSSGGAAAASVTRAQKQLRPERDIVQAAMSDPDAKPLTDARLRTMKRVPRTKTMRWALNLTQSQFATRFKIPIGTLRDWEQGRSEPDQTAKVLLHLIADDPGGVARAIARLKRK